MCSTIYSTCTYSKKFQMAYNDAFRILLKLPRRISANQMFVMTFHAMLRNFVQKFRCWLINSKNVVIIFLTVPTLGNTRYSSYFWKHWNICLIITDDCLFVVVVFSCFFFFFYIKNGLWCLKQRFGTASFGTTVSSTHNICSVHQHLFIFYWECK